VDMMLGWRTDVGLRIGCFLGHFRVKLWKSRILHSYHAL